MSRIGLVIVVIVYGCGGDAAPSSQPPAPQPPAPAATTASFQVQYPISPGPASGCVNALGTLLPQPIPGLPNEPCVDAATRVTLDGDPIAVADIPDGSLATVRGTFQNEVLSGARASSVATSIDVQRVLVGTIEAVDWAHARFSALDHQVYVSDATRFVGYDAIASLAPGDRVSVSGFFSPGGDIIATSIARDASGKAFVLRGMLGFDDNFGMVRVGPLEVGSYWDIAFVGFRGDGPVDGDPVLAFGDESGGGAAAYMIRFIGGDWGEGSEDVRYLMGMVSSRSGPTQIAVAGRELDCVYFSCDAATEAQVGSLVGVAQYASEGSPVSHVGVLAPTSDRIVVAGAVEGVDAENRSLSVLGFPTQLLPATAMRDEAGRPTRVGDIEVGDTVMVSGGPVSDRLVAGRLFTYTDETAPSTPWIATREVVYDEPDLHVLGRTIITDEGTAVYDCVDPRDLRWLFDVAARQMPETLLTVEVSFTSAGEMLATNIEVGDLGCPWAY